MSAEHPTLVAAIRQGQLNPRTGQFKHQGRTLSLSETLKQDLIDTESHLTEGMSLSDALGQGLIDSRSGKFVDRYSGHCVPLSEAIQRGLLDPNRLEIFDTKSQQKITLQSALNSNVIIEANGKYHTGKIELPLNEAAKKNFIYNPLTLKECDDYELLQEENASIKDPINNTSMSLLDAVGAGILDVDLQSIKDTRRDQYVNLAEALKTDIVDPKRFEFLDTASGDKIPLSEAVKKGYLTTVAQKSIFDIDGIKDQSTGDFISFNIALDKGVIDKVSGKVVDQRTKHKLGFSEAAQKGLIQDQLLDMLKRPIGIKNASGKEGSLLEAVTDGKVDPNSGLIIDTTTTKTIPLEQAIQKGVITALGAAVLKSLLNITVTTATVTQTVRRSVQISSGDVHEGGLLFDDAMRHGWIDEAKGLFNHPESGKMPIEEALSLGLLQMTSSSSSSTSMRKSSQMSSSSYSQHSSSRSSPIKEHRSDESSPRDSRGQSPDKFGRKESVTSSRKTSTSSNGSSSLRRSVNPPKSGTTQTRKDSRVEGLDTAFEGTEVSSTTTFSAFKSSSVYQSSMDCESTNGSTRDLSVPSFTLKDAIDDGLLDGAKGLFKVPNSESTINFKESVEMGYIRSRSASVVLTEMEQPPMNLKKALERDFMDDFGVTKDGRRTYTIQQAMRTGRIKNIKTSSQRSSSRASIASEIDTGDDYIDIQQRIRFKKNTGAFEVHPDLTPADLLQALQEDKLRPHDIMVRCPTKENTSLNILEAIRAGYIDKNTGEYTTNKGKKHNIVDAIKFGYITFMGIPNKTSPSTEQQNIVAPSKQGIRDGTIHARVVQSGVTTTRISSFMVEVPGTDEEITLDEAVSRGLVSEETAKLYKEEVTTDSQVESVVVLITNPETGEEIPSDEAVAKGIVTQEEVEEFLHMQDHQATSVSEVRRGSKAIGKVEAGKIQSTLTKRPSSPSKDHSRPSSAASREPQRSLSRSSSRRTTPSRSSPYEEPSKPASKTPSTRSTPSRSVPISKESSPTKSSREPSFPISPEKDKVFKKPAPPGRETNGSGPGRSIPVTKETLPTNGTTATNGVPKTKPTSRLPRRSPSPPKPGSPVKESRPSSVGKPSTLPTKETGAPKRPTSLGSPTKDKPFHKSPFSSRRESPKSPTKSFSPALSRSSSQRAKTRKTSSSSSNSSSGSSSDEDKDQYRTEMTIDLDKQIDKEDYASITRTESASHTVRTQIVNLKPGYALSTLDNVRNLATGETMSIYEAKLRGIASDVRDDKSEYVTQQVRVFVNEAINKGLINFTSGTFTHPISGEPMPIGDAIRQGLLITNLKDDKTTEVSYFNKEAQTISLGDAFQHCFDLKTKKFHKSASQEKVTLTQAVDEEWINGQDVIFDVSSNSQTTLKEALDTGVINGKTCEYTVKTTKEKFFILEAAQKGLVAVFPEAEPELELADVTYTLQETFDNGVFDKRTNLFMEVVNQKEITIIQALRVGLIDFRSAEVRNTKSDDTLNLYEAIEEGVINKKSGKFVNLKTQTEMTLFEAYEQGFIVALERQGSPFECITLWDAIDRNQLDTQTGMFYSVHEENKKMTLEEAVYRKYIDKKSAFVKDTWKRKYCSLSEASRKNVIKDGRVMNTTTGKYLSVQEAIDLEIIVRDIRHLSLIEILDFGMYQPHSGQLIMPGFDRQITLREAIEFRLIDHQKTIVKNQKSQRYISTLEALRSGDIDGNTGMYGSMNLLEARSKGYLLTNDAMKAVQEKFRQAGENLDDLNSWLDKIEREIAGQEALSEDVTNLKSQIKTMKVIKDDVDDHNRPVNNTIDIIVELVETGSDVLSSAELNQLQTEGKRLKERYTYVSDSSDKLMKRMASAMDELAKFRGEMGSFRTWLEKAFKTLEDKERQLANLNKLQGNADDIKSFVSDVMTHGADLKFLTISGQKFVDLSKDYVSCLNEFRVKLRSSHLKQGESQVSDEVTRVSGDYHELLERANRLADRFTRVGSKQRDYNDAVDRAKKWLGQTEPKVSKLCSEPIGAEPRVVEDQLNRSKALHNEIIANRKLVDDAKQAAFNLLSSLDDGQMSPQERRQIEVTPNELQERYDSINDAMASRCAELDSALVQSQGVQDALANIDGWLNLADNQLKSINKPASLIRERLDEQIRQVRILQADIDSHEPSIQKMYQAAQDFVQSAKNIRESKKIETKVKEVQKKFEGLIKTVENRAIFLDEVSRELDDFTVRVENFDEWYVEMIDILESREMLAMDADESGAKIDEISRRKDQKRPDFEDMMRIGKNLVSKKDVTDSGPCKDTLKELEEKWNELGEILGERQNLDRARKQSLNAYEQLRMDVTRWLSNMERKVDSLEPVAVDSDILKRQIDEVKPLIQEHSSYSKTIDKFNEIAIQYDSFLRGNMENGSSVNRRASVTPRKSSLTPALLSNSRRPSAISGKFGPAGSRRESAAPMFQDQSPVQLQLAEVNNRYDMIGMRLSDRDKDLVIRKEEIRIHLDNIKKIHAFLEKQERNFPRDTVPTDKRESDKMLRVIKGILDQLYENQPLLDETKVGVKDLLKKNRDAPGAPELEDRLNEVVLRWKDLQDKCKEKVDLLDELKDFHELHDSLNNWLNAKGRMMNVLGPIASDPRLVQNQMSQIAVMREEFNEKLPQKDRFNEIGELLLQDGGDKQVEDKLDNINHKWDDLLAQLEERERALDALAGPTRDFMNLTNKLTDNLGKISDGLDDVATSKADPEQKMRSLEGISNDLDNQRPLWAEIESVGDQLMDILTDPASKSEIKGKLGQVERQFNNCQKKLDNALAELENAAREGREFDSACANMEDMLGQFEHMLADKLAISADKEILRQQIQEYEPIYQEIMGKEHEVIMIINRGRDIITRAKKGDTRTKQKLENIEKTWQKLKKIAQDRQKRLNTAMEHCRKYNSSLDRFIPWLEKAETTLERMAPISFVKPELQKQEKELQSFRNDVNRHSSEYEGTTSGGFTFVDACDVDKEIVKEELAILKERWDNLNLSITDRSQAIADILNKLGDFNDDVRDLGNNLNRMEDKMKSLDNAPQDAKTLDAIKGLLEDANGLDKLFGKVQKNGDDLINDADHLGSDASNIQDTVGRLGDRLGDLRDRLEHKADDLQNAGQALGEFNDKIKELNNALSMLDDELNKMGPIGRDLEILNHQMDEVHTFVSKIQRHRIEVEDAAHLADDLASRGFTSGREAKETINGLNRQLEKLDSRAHSREKDIDSMIVKVQAFYDLYSGVMGDIQEVINEERAFGAIGGDIDSIKQQQEEFKNFQRRVVEAVGKEVEKTNRNGQSLIQSAASGVNTSTIEQDLEKMNDLWNSLKQNIADRDRKLDQGLLQSGKFQEALNGLLSWMDEMDDMLANQKPPSSDYKVIKAQVQEQKFVAKLLGDRKSAIASLVKMGKEIAATADPAERRKLESDINNLEGRYADLNKRCQDRMDLLEDAMKMAKEYNDKLGPLEKWLDKTEKKVKDMETVPTEEDQIQRRIQEHDRLHDDILGKQPSFDDLADIASALMQVVGDEDAQGLADKIEELTNRYGALVNASDNISQLLKDSMAGLRNLVLAYEDLLSWMERMEQRLSKYKILSVFTDKLVVQMEELHGVTEEVVSKQRNVDEVLHHGNDLMRNITSEEALQLKDKLDSLQRKYNDLATKAADLLKNAQEMLPLVQNFHQNHNRLNEWMTGVEGIFQSLDTYNLEDQELEIKRLEQDVQDNRPLLESINISGPQLCQMSPGDGARTIEDLVTRDNRRFDAICEQIQRRGERIQLSKQRSSEVLGDIDELLNWFREVENQIREADPPSSEPDVIRVQLKEHKALNDDISSQKGRVRDVLSNAKKVLRESAQTSETEQVKEKMEDLKETMDTVIVLSNDRLSILEQALPLAEHFYETHNELSNWLDDIEREVMNQLEPGMRPDQVAKQQEINRSLIQSVQDHKPVLDRLNKTGGALLRLVVEDDAYRVQDIIENDNQRYNAIKVGLRERQQALEEAMQECSQFTDKLDGMLNALANTADQVNNAEPISSHPEKIREQMDDNNAIIDDLAKKETAFDAVKQAADDIIRKAPNKNDPAIKDIKKKLDKLNQLWDQIQKGTKDRSDSLEDALALAEKFWDELQAVMARLREIQDALNNQDPPGVEPKIIEAQKAELKNIKREIDNTKPGVDDCRQTGKNLIKMVGDAERPELRRHIDDMDQAWDNITSMFARREQNLLEAMEKAMEFHETLQSLLEFLAKAERKFDNLGPIGSDIDQVKKQIAQLKAFKDEVDPWMIKVEALNRSLRRQAHDLTDKTDPGQARSIKEPLADVNKRWDELNKGISNRQKDLENALLRLGQFQHALNELLIWIERTDKTLDSLKPVFGDPQVIEVELAKLKVMVNDIQAHQSSVDTLNDAGRQIIESDQGSREASNTQQKLNELNTKWNNLLGKAEGRQLELEDALREAQAFNQEIQDMLLWLNDVDAALSQSKPVGGLPETAKDQLERFMEVFRDLESTGPKVEALLARGNDYLKKSRDGSATNLQNNLRTLKSRWENILSRANDKKIKLEIALKEATEFHEALQAFIDWLTSAEKRLSSLKPVSRILETIKIQIEEHKEFQNEVSSQRETMLSLDKKGTHLKYFSQKQDVILIKNLLVSVQNRWEKVVSKSAERTRALDYGYKEAKEFHDAWDHMCTWLDEAETRMGDLGSQNKNDPIKIKKEIERHKQFQKELSAKQPMYDSTMKNGKQLKDKAPKTDEPVIKSMLIELKEKWLKVCNLSVEKQRKLEEALLFSGQFKDALKALMDWLKDMEMALDNKTPVHGDLDTVIGLVEKHKNFEQELNGRSEQVDSLKRTAEDLLETAEREDAVKIRAQVTELTNKWENVWSLSKNKTKRLEDALKQAEELHKSVNMLLEWLSDAEMKLRFSGPLPEDEDEVERQIREHEKFMAELKEKEKDKDYTLKLAQEILAKCHPDAVNVIKHWITIIQSRWDEVASWALQRKDKLDDHLKQLKDILALLDELMQWLIGKENVLTDLEREPLPDDLEIIRQLIDEHQSFMDGLSTRQPEIDSVCKPMRPKSTAPSSRRPSRMSKAPGRESREHSPDFDPSRRPSHWIDREWSSPSRDYPKPWLDYLYEQSSIPIRDDIYGGRRTSRISPGDRATPDRRPRFDRKGSRASVSYDQGIKNPRAKALWDKWRHVWMMAWERDRRLKEKLSYLQELENVKNFNWEEWRKRFLKFHNNKKSRVTDLMRKLDEDVDGFLARDEFVEGILKNKFPSSRLEMNAVADKFDHGEGMIDWREFMAALRPDWEDRGPLTDTERIDDEINRQVSSCTCRQKFKVFQVGEGKYRFGESQKLRLVRILRSTVMVRVGGGWVALDEFLVKNDPCRVVIHNLPNLETPDEHEWWCPFGIQVEIIRMNSTGSLSGGNESRKASTNSRKSSKGRTNVELREQFTLASGVSQSMTPFKSRASVSGASGQRPSVSGPITKIKEKSERSLPMQGTRQSFDAGGASYADDTMAFQSRRSSAMPSGSRNGSRPPSRTGSNMSLNSDDSPRGTSVRRSSSMRSGGRVSSLRPNPVGFGSSAPRKASSPMTNGNRMRTNSNSSTDRTPMSARVRSKSYITPRPSPLIKTASATNIPVFVGCYSSRDNLSSANTTPLRTRLRGAKSVSSLCHAKRTSYITARSRTPSSSSIPVPINQRNRTPSGAGGSSATSGRIQRSGSGVASNFDSRRTSKTTTSYGADGARITSTTTTFNTAGTSSAKSEGAFGQQTATRNW
ncbi:microtubule-actin cross-linking factor 1-like isoform X2 [Tigriopus californicus]|uniref:microtubule-actin cross-linking factor 1-like isoform X2 n=1 Tax=Tigriopus californicus TaxID=6832 RepID=UPI0027DA3AEC|nr:microtubule-actin cross-linking factor 1-like isoform X2 [Tigriopus californicus]